MSKGYALKRFIEANAGTDRHKAAAIFREAITPDPKTGEVLYDATKANLPELARLFLGDEYGTARRRFAEAQAGRGRMTEAGEWVDASNFAAITGQLMVTLVKEGYNDPVFIGDKLFRKYPNPGGNLQAHKIPYLSAAMDKGEAIQSGQTYGRTTFQGAYVTMPAPTKRGQIIELSFEFIYSDLTGQWQKAGKSGGRALRYGKEEWQLRTLAGMNGVRWTFGLANAASSTDYSLYYSTTPATITLVNKVLSTTIANYTGINTVEQLFWRMVDPITGRIIAPRPKTIVCVPEKRYDIGRIVNPHWVRDATSGVHMETPSPLETQYEVLTSPILRSLLATTAKYDDGTDWTGLSDSDTKEQVFFGDYQEALGWREVYDFQEEEAPALNPEQFNRDIAWQGKFGYFGCPFAYDIHFMGKATSEGS